MILTFVRQGDDVTMVIVPVSGGAPVNIALPRHARPVPDGGNWDWSPDGRFVYYISRAQNKKTNGIWRVPAAGGTPQLALWFDEGS